MIYHLILSLLFLLSPIATFAAPTSRPLPTSGRITSPRAIDSQNSSSSTAQIDAFLNTHNAVRARHQAPPLTWSTSLAEKAKRWADRCQFRHTNGVLSDTPYGENIVAATGDFPISAAVNTFIQDEANYDPRKPTFNHFTQVVWKSTTELGCAMSKCNNIFLPSRDTATMYVCLYNPVGNVVGELLHNVLL